MDDMAYDFHCALNHRHEHLLKDKKYLVLYIRTQSFSVHPVVPNALRESRNHYASGMFGGGKRTFDTSSMGDRQIKKTTVTRVYQ